MADVRLFDLLRIGLTEGESKVYLTLLELGSSTVGPIVKNARVAYSNVYDILNRLIEKGLVSYIIKNQTRYFQAVGPANLIDYLEKKEQEIARQKELIKEMLPKLTRLQQIPSQQAEIFIGIKGLTAAYEKLFSNLNTNNLYAFFYIYKEAYGEKADRFYWRMFNKFLRGIKLETRGIANTEYRKSWFVKKMEKFHMSMRYVDYPTAGNIDIYQDKILIVSWIPEPIAFLITSKGITEDFMDYFNTIWKTAKP